ncbi:hypothetical protein ACFZ8E_25185 [Methylobacterium sp. HMF5984]|uniref:hypothetical protein n=1 Tax=Methylobacterium sp. HMF5984 TaxID=3367370 RepID=UPI003854E0F9
MGVLSWALDRLANAFVDPTIPAVDGASARSYPDLIRGLMSGTRAYADDQGGAITTKGVGNAYVAVTASGVTALRPGLSLLFKVHATNTDLATLNVDGTGPKPWADRDGNALIVGGIAAGHFLRATYDADRDIWLSDILAGLSLSAFDVAFRSWVLTLPNAPDGLGPGRPWKTGDAAGGYTLQITGTNT